MKHAREDYNRIQDPAGLIPDDEPVFLLRGQDALAIEAIARWIDMAQANDVDPAMVAAARAQMQRMREWQGSRRIKVPDMPAPKED